METGNTVLPRKQRTLHAPPFRLTERDTQIIEAVHRYRILERSQVEQLFFAQADGLAHTNTNRARERLRFLYQHGYLERILRPIHPWLGSHGPAYRLAARGARLLAECTGTSLHEFHYWGRGDDKDARQTQVTSMFLEHGIAAASVRIAIERAALANGCRIEVWHDEITVRRNREWDSVMVALSPERQPERIPIIPDGYFVLTTPQGRGHFFLEVDRTTETIANRWQRKIWGYKEYVLSGGFHQRYALNGPQTPLRILTTTLSPERAQNLKVAAERYGPPQAAQLFLFAPLSDISTHNPLTSVMWLRAGDVDRQAIL